MGQAKIRKKMLGTAYGTPVREPKGNAIWEPVGEISPAVLRLRDDIDPTSTPEKVPIRPPMGSKMLMCHVNVQEYVQSHGGVQIYGWRIEEQENIFLQATFHSVLQVPPDERVPSKPYSPSGWVDITPFLQGDTETIFIPDSTSDWAKVPVKELGLKERYISLQPNDPEVDEYIECSRLFQDLKWRSRQSHETLQAYSAKIARLSAKLTLRYGNPVWHPYAEAELRRFGAAV